MILSLAGWTTQQPPRVAASLASVQTTLVLALLAFFAGISAAARSTNKTQSTVVIPVVGDYLEFAGDQTLFGVRMAIQEINNSSDILQDVALIPMRINLDLTNPATLYDSSISLCDSIGVRALVSQMLSRSCMAISSVCPKALHSSAYAASVLLSNKRVYPLYFRYVSTFTQLAGGIAAQFKYFGWSKIGIVSASSSIYPTVLSTYVDVFKGYGVSVLATVILPDYDSSVSTMYYPQIRQPFEFLRQTGLRIFFASVPPQQIMDVMMAANKTGLVGRDYYWATIQNGISIDPTTAKRWDTALDPMLLRGVALIQNIQGPFFDDPYYQSWKPRFDTFLAHTLAYETSLYHDINPSQTDPTAQDYPSSFFFDDPGTNQYPAFFLLAGYDGMWTIARTLERAIVRSGLDGMALANGSLAPFVKLSDVIDIAANMNTLVGVKSLTSSGDASPDPLYLSQLTGATFGMNSAVRVAVIEYNSTTAKSTFVPNQAAFIWVGNRTFFDFPIDYPPANNDYVDPQSSITVAVVVLSLAVTLVCLLCSVFYYSRAQRQSIKPRAPYNLAITGVGLALIPLNVFTLIGMDKPAACAFRPWPVILGLTIMLACIVVKNAQLYVIFKTHPKSWLSPIRRIGPLQTLEIVAAITAFVSLPIAAITAGKDVYSDSVYLGASSKYLWVCEITWEGSALLGTAIAMISGMACLALFFGYANRDLPDMFNNSKAGAGATALSALFASITLAQGASSTSTKTQFLFEGFASIITVLINGWILLGSASSDSGSKSLHIEAKLVAADTEAAAEIKRQRNVIAFNGVPAFLQGGIFPQWRRIMVVLFPEPVFMVKLMAKSDSEIPKYLPLRSLKNVYHRDNISKLDLPMCVLEVGDVRVTMQFSSTSKMRAWIDAVGRATLRQRAIGHSQGHSPSGIPIELPPQGQLIEELRSGKRK